MRGRSSPRGRAARVRIIGGAWRRRWLPVADVPGLRPSADAQRETLFNWVQPRLPGARVLDLFAGTGALGLEAASRGAASVLLVEKNAVAARQLDASCTLLGAAQVTVVQGDALRFLSQGPDPAGYAPFDLVFLDPPFGQGLVQKALDRLQAGGWVTGAARIYVEQETGLPAPAGWVIERERTGGQAHGLLLVSTDGVEPATEFGDEEPLVRPSG
jgi:16S rRNA (guanine966-N2)-methyltransferase